MTEKTVQNRTKANRAFIEKVQNFVAKLSSDRNMAEQALKSMSRSELRAFIGEHLSAKAARAYEKALESPDLKIAATVAKDVIDRNLGKAVQTNVNHTTGSIEHVVVHQMPAALLAELDSRLVQSYAPPLAVLEGEVVTSDDGAADRAGR